MEKIFYVLDTETTGLSPNTADVIEVAALKVQEDENGHFSVLEEFDTYINPQYPLPAEIVEFNRRNNTGICDEMLAKAPTADIAARRLYLFLGDKPLVVGHNIVKFDARFIDKLYIRQLEKRFECRMIDTLEEARRLVHGERGCHKLGSLFERTEKRHSAANPKFHTVLADCYATLDVLEYLLELDKGSR